MHLTKSNFSCLILVIVASVLVSVFGGASTLPQGIDVTQIPVLLSANGIALPRIGLGTAGLRSATTEVVLSALDMGYKLIDTAQATEWYDEAAVGAALRETSVPLTDLVVVTKVHPRSFEKSKLLSMIRNSKQVLYGNTSRPLDVVLLHSPHCWQNSCTAEEERHSWKEAWFALQELKKSGDVAAIGVSNFDSRLLGELLDISNVKISVIQNWMDPFHQDEDVRQLAASHGITYMSYSAYGGQWDWKLQRNPVFSSDILQSVADKHSTSIARVVTSWVLQSNCVAIPRSSNLDHLMDNFVAETFLDADDMALIRSLDGSLGNLWDE